MQNNTSKTGYQNSRLPQSGRRQQIQNGIRYGDESSGEKRALLVQRNDLISSKTGLKSRSFVPAKRIEICASTNSGKDGGQRIPPLLNLNLTEHNARSCTQNDRNSRNADVTNNSSNKRSYFEPYDPRRSPGVRNNGNIGAQPGPAMCQYVQPYQQFNYYQQFPGPHNGFQYQRVQAPNAATAVAPNGETIYIPLDDRQYEIKKDNHDLYDMPDGCELLLLESAGEFESSVQLISSPRPVDLKGGLSQDSRSDSGESSDEISYGEPDTDSDSESESEFVENCVSDVLKTIAESVQNITVEESKDIVQRALKDFEDSQETATERNVLESISNDSKTTLPNTCKSVNKSETSKTDNTESDITSRHSANVIKSRTLDSCFGLTGSHDLTKPQSLQRKKQHFVERTIMNDLFEKSEPYSTNDDHSKSGPIMDKTAIISESSSTKVVSSNSDVHTHSNMNTVKPWSKDVHPYNNASRKAKPRRKQTEIMTATSKNDTSGLVPTCNKPKLDNKQNKCETMFRPSAPGGVFDKPSSQAINSESNSKRGTSVPSTSQHSSVPDSLFANNDRNSKANIPRNMETYDCPLTNAPSDITNKSERALGNDLDNTHDNCRHIASPNQWVIQGQQEPVNSEYPLYEHYSPVGASNEWKSLIQPGAQNVTGGCDVTHNISEFGPIYGVPVHNEWFLPDKQSFFSPSFINSNRNLPSPGAASNHQGIVNHTCSSNDVQDEWAVSQNIGSVEQVLSPSPFQNVWTSPQMLTGFRSSPVSYGPAGMERAMYEAGQVMIDGQGFFESSHHINDQHQTVYLPDNITFEAHQPAPSHTATPVYTLSIQEPSTPSSPGMVCQPDHQYVHGELASSSKATSYQSKTRGLSADSQVFEPGKQHYGRHESESSDCSQSIDLVYQQYGDSQPITPVDQNCVNTTGETIYDKWNAQVGTVQQNGQQDGVMLETNHIVDESLGECIDGQFYVCYDVENVYTDPQSGLSYPAIHMTDDYLLTVLFKDGVCLEIAVDKSMRLVHHENKLVAAMSGSGEQTCIIHPAARIYQTTSDVHATVYNNRRAKLTDEYVTFGSEKESFKFDQRQITSIDHSKATYMDLSDDESVKLLQTDDGTPADNDKLRDKCMEILAHAHFWKHGKNGSTVIINGTKIVQSDKGDVTVNCGPIKFIRMNPTKSVIRLKTQLVEADIETNWTVRLSRGHLALNVIQAGLMVSNGKIKGYLDRDDKLQAFSLPDHRVLMLGQPVPQHRPGVPTRSRRNDHNKKTEPEGDHSGYSSHIVDNVTERGRQGNNRQWETF